MAALLTDEHGLASSLDADTEVEDEATGEVHGEEGRTYVWTPEDLFTHLGPEDGAWAAALMRVGRPGTFERGTSTAQLAQDVWADPFAAARWQGIREKLRLVRETRPQPARDDKVVAAWNGLAIAALAETGALLERPDLVKAAERIASLVLRVHIHGSGVVPRLYRTSRHGNHGAAVGVLEDYADGVYTVSVASQQAAAQLPRSQRLITRTLGNVHAGARVVFQARARDRSA